MFGPLQGMGGDPGGLLARILGMGGQQGGPPQPGNNVAPAGGQQGGFAGAQPFAPVNGMQPIIAPRATGPLQKIMGSK